MVPVVRAKSKEQPRMIQSDCLKAKSLSAGRESCECVCNEAKMLWVIYLLGDIVWLNLKVSLAN